MELHGGRLPPSPNLSGEKMKPIEVIYNNDNPFALSEVKVFGKTLSPLSVTISLNSDDEELLTLVFRSNHFSLATEEV